MSTTVSSSPSEPLISVLMVNRNHADTIGEAVTSVLSQTWSNLELVVVDDGSTDDSVSVVEGIARKDPRVRLHRLPRNEHICAATNRGFTLVSGEWLARIDSDDVWYPTRLERQMEELAAHPEFDICFTWADWIDENGDPVPELEGVTDVTYPTQREWLRRFYFEGNCLLHSSVLMRMSLRREVGDFDLAYRMLHDFDYWVRVAKRRNILVVPERLIAMRHFTQQGRNSSEATEENDTRTFNEYVDIRSHFFEGMSDEVFVDAFSEDFVCPDSSTKDELACERALLLCRPPVGWISKVNPAGLRALRELLNRPDARELLERRYGFTVHSFYELTGSHYYNDVPLQLFNLNTQRSYEAQVNYLIDESLGLQAKKLELEAEISRLQDENRRLGEKIGALEGSISWRLTRPLRAASRIVRGIAHPAPAPAAPSAPALPPAPPTVLVHAFLAGNLGDDLFVRTLCDRYPDVRFLACAPGDYEGRFSDVANLEIRPPAEFGGLVKTADAVAHIGGCCFVQHEKDFSPFFQTDEYLAKNARHLVFMGGNFGPYQDDSYLDAYRDLFRGYDGLSFRDHYSAGLFEGYPNVLYAPDILFGFPARRAEKQRRAVVAPISLAGRDGAFAISQHAEAYRRFTVSSVRALLARGYEVSLVSFCEAQGDEEEIASVVAELSDEERARVSVSCYRRHPDEVVRELEVAECVVATRFHAMVLGFAHGCRVLPVVYDQKTRKVLDDLSYPLSVDVSALDSASAEDLVKGLLETEPLDAAPLAEGSAGHFRFFDGVLKEVRDGLRAQKPPEHCQVLFVNGTDLPTLRRYRVEHQREQLELWGVSTGEVHYLSVSPLDAERADVFVIYRCAVSEQVEEFVRRAHELGKRVYFDVDDLVVDTRYTEGLPVVAAMSPEDREVFQDGVMRMGRTLELCDGAIVTTDRLAEELSDVTPTVLVNRNVASREMVAHSERAMRTVRRDPGRVVLGYFSGSMTHNADFAEALPAIVSVMERRPEVFLEVVGDLELPDELEPLSERVIHAQKVSWQELPSLIATADVNLAPLEPTLFNEAKSENKWTEAALVGVPTVASDFGAFASAIEDGRTGLLCSTREDWESALLRLVDDADLRREIGQSALAHVRSRCVTERTGFSLARLLVEAPADLEHAVPADEAARARLVREHLESRGLERARGEFEAEPWRDSAIADRLASARDAAKAGRDVLLLVYERECGDAPTFRYFGYNVAQRLGSSERAFATYLFVDELGSEEGRALLSLANALSLVRCRVRPELVTLAREAKARGVRVAYTIDDNALGAQTSEHIIQLMATDPTNDFERRFWRGTTERFRLASELADALVVPGDFFAGLLRERAGKPVLVLRSSVNDEQVAIAERIVHDRGEVRDGRFLVGYFSGTSSHREDFALVEDALCSFLERHDDAALVLGGSLELSERLVALMARGRVIAVPRVDYVTLQYLQASVDVVLAPLVVDEFTNCKSGLKVFEAAIVGTPACASPAFAYREAIEEGVTGYVCETTADWERALEALRSDRDACSRMGDAARAYALERYYGDAVRAQAEQVLAELLAVPSLPVPDEVGRAVSASGVTNWDDPFEASPAFA